MAQIQDQEDDLFTLYWEPIIRTLFPEDMSIEITSAQLRVISRNMFDIGIAIGQRIMTEGVRKFKAPKDAMPINEYIRQEAIRQVQELKAIAPLERRQKEMAANNMKLMDKTRFMRNSKR